MERSGRTWSFDFDFDYHGTNPTYRADNGFETRNNSRRVTMFQQLNFHPESFVERISLRIHLNRNWNFESDRKAQGFEFGLEATLKGQTDVAFEYNTRDERFRGVLFEGLDVWAASIESAFSEYLSLDVGVEHGESIARNVGTPVLGSGTDVDISATIRPASWVSLRPSFVYSDLSAGGEQVFNGYILRNRADLQFTRELFLRLVVEYDSFDRALVVEPLLTYRVNPFTLVYVGSSRGYQDFEGPRGWTRTETQYFAKVQYLIRR